MALSLLLMTLSLRGHSQHLYQMSDLEVLLAEKNTKEFLAHALDIRPSERSKTWREMVSQMALLALEEASSESLMRLDTFDRIQIISSWPVLVQDDLFQLRRSDYALKFFNQCFTKHTHKACLDRAHLYRTSSRANPNFSLALLNLFKKYLPTMPRQDILLSITKSEFANSFCARAFIQEELSTLLLSHALKSAQKIKPQNYANKACLDHLVGPLKEMLFSDYIAHGTASFRILRELEALSSSEYDQFYAFYLLAGPESGEIFNLAWNNLKLLGRDFERRERVLSFLKTLDPLPGKSFGDSDIRKRRTLSEAFWQYFPEYPKYYVSQCLNYLEGKGEFVHGNPTPYCDDLIMVGKMNRTISDEVYLKHSALKKFKVIKK